MTQFEKLAAIANQLSQDEPDPIPQIPWHARNTIHVHEYAYYLCKCGRGFTDIASKRQHQAWCRKHLGGTK